MRVLLVENDERLADNIARFLRKKSGYAVDVATDGAQGLYLAESSPYDLVVLDLRAAETRWPQFARPISRTRTRHSRSDPFVA